jgi:ABC-2 type transport system permease protein
MNRESENSTMSPPGVPVIRSVNWGGLYALYMKEVRRFFKVQTQTIWAPALTSLMYLIIFTVALGGGGRQVLAVPFADFIAPGLIIMGMMQNAFANSSFSLLVGKMQGTIFDYLMPPLSNMELLTGLTAAAVTRAVLVGFTIWLAMLLWPGVHVRPVHLWAVFWFGLMGSMFLALIGLMTSIWADKFDQLHRRAGSASFGNFLFGRPAVPDLSGYQPREPVFLCHIGLSLRLYWQRRQSGTFRCRIAFCHQHRAGSHLLLDVP